FFFFLAADGIRDFHVTGVQTCALPILGPHVDGFEKDLANYIGSGIHVAALSTGTAAIHLGLILLGVKAGDEVLCQSFTFCGSSNPITYIGAVPVFVDSEPDTWNMSPEFLEEA